MTLIHGDVSRAETWEGIGGESIQCCVTSPPYWRQRNYEVDKQLGLEPTIEDYVANLVRVFSHARRVMTRDSTLWLNLGDCYNGSGGAGGDYGPKGRRAGQPKYPGRRVRGLAHKNLIGAPWRVAFALQSDGWILRQCIIWDKGYGYESVGDRPTTEHEYVFFFSKSAKCYYNKKAVEVPLNPATVKRAEGGWNLQKTAKSELYVTQGPHRRSLKEANIELAEKIRSGEKTGKNLGSVWRIRPNGRDTEHLASFPVELPELCIKAGSKKGDIVLDPFVGSGTTGEVALRLGRKFVGIDLNEKYLNELARPRLESVNPLGLDNV